MKEIMIRSYEILAKGIYTVADELEISHGISSETLKIYGEMAVLLRENKIAEALHLNIELEGILKSYKNIFEKIESKTVAQGTVEEERRAVSVKEQFAEEYEQGIIDNLTLKEVRDMVENDIMDGRKEFIDRVDSFSEQKTEQIESELTAAEQIVLQADVEVENKNYKRAFDYFAEAEARIFNAKHIIATG